LKNKRQYNEWKIKHPLKNLPERANEMGVILITDPLDEELCREALYRRDEEKVIIEGDDGNIDQNQSEHKHTKYYLNRISSKEEIGIALKDVVDEFRTRGYRAIKINTSFSLIIEYHSYNDDGTGGFSVAPNGIHVKYILTNEKKNQS
jgi:hypothetical protein